MLGPGPSLLLAAVLAGAAGPQAGATVPPRPLDLSALGSPVFTAFTTRDGLPDSTAGALATDAEGFVWTSTAVGTYRYDGNRWELVERPELPGRAPNLHLDESGTLWAALDNGGLAWLDRSGWHREGSESGLPTDRFFRVLELPDGAGGHELWALSIDAGLFRRVGGRWQADPGNAELPSGRLHTIVRTREIGGRERLWVATFNDGLWFREMGGVWQRFRDERLPAAQVDDLVVTSRHGTEELWIATYGLGLLRLTVDGLAAMEATGAAPETRIVYNLRASAQPGGNRTVWASTRGGVLRVQGEDVQVFDRRHGLPSNVVSYVHLWRSPDGIEVLWVATEGGVGRAVLGDSPWRTASLLGSKANGVFGVLVEPDGRGGERLWVAAAGDGIGLFEAGRWRTFSEADGSLPGSSARLLVRVPDEAGRHVLFTSTTPGELLRVHEGPRFERVPSPWPKDSGQHVMDLLAREAGGQHELWVATRQSGVYRFRGGSWTAFRAPTAAGQWRVVKLVEQVDSRGRSWLWATTNQGLARFDGSGWTLLGRGEGLPDVELLGLTLLPDGTGRPVLWIGSYRSGIIRADVADPLHPLVLPAGDLPKPPAPTAYSALRDSKGRLYVSTDAGVQLLTPDGSGGYTQRLFRRRDGLVHEECNTNAQLIDAHDRYWAGTLAGLSVYDPMSTVSDRHSKPLRPLRVKADGREVDAAPVRVPSNVRELRFETALLSWQREDESRFRWQLVGYDPRPGPWVDEPSRIYGALPPGRYVLRVEARDYAGLRSGPIEVPVEIVPAWWQRLWFRFGVLVLVVLAAPAFYRHRVVRLSRQKEELERLVSARTSELAAANDRLAQLSREDPLTGVANRRRFDEALEVEWRRARRLRLPLGLIMLDIDGFKAYNDALGHPAGDACLSAFAPAISAGFTRAGELVARYGGEEFVVLLPGATRESVLAAGENVRRRVAELGIPHPSSTVAPVVTVSVGVAWMAPEHGVLSGALVDQADRALYRAKNDGRNCVREAGAPTSGTPGDASERGS